MKWSSEPDDLEPDDLEPDDLDVVDLTWSSSQGAAGDGRNDERSSIRSASGGGRSAAHRPR